MEDTIKIDKQGRIVLPSHIRRKLRLEGSGLRYRLNENRIILEPTRQNLEKNVDEWVKEALKTVSPPLSEKAEPNWKWMSLEYAKRKLNPN